MRTIGHWLLGGLALIAGNNARAEESKISLDGLRKQGWHLTPSLSLYSESTYQARTANFINENQLRVNLAQYGQSVQTYLGVATAQDTRSSRNEVFQDNYVAPLFGVRLKLPVLPVAAFIETRQAFRFGDVPGWKRSSESEFRLGSFGYHLWDPWSITRQLRIFQETYAEAVFSSRLDHNLVGTGWIKQGPRLAVSPFFTTDAYVEIRAARDSQGFSYNNYQSGAAGVRAHLRLGPVVTQLGLSRDLAHSVFPTSWNGQLILSGELQ